MNNKCPKCGYNLENNFCNKCGYFSGSVQSNNTINYNDERINSSKKKYSYKEIKSMHTCSIIFLIVYIVGFAIIYSINTFLSSLGSGIVGETTYIYGINSAYFEMFLPSVCFTTIVCFVPLLLSVIYSYRSHSKMIFTTDLIIIILSFISFIFG